MTSHTLFYCYQILCGFFNDPHSEMVSKGIYTSQGFHELRSELRSFAGVIAEKAKLSSNLFKEHGG